MRVLIVIILSIVSTVGLAQRNRLYVSEGDRSFVVNPASVGTLNKLSISNRLSLPGLSFQNSSSNFQLNGAVKCLKFGNKENPNIRGAIGLKLDYNRFWYLWQTGVSIQSNLQFKLNNSFLSIGIAPGIRNVSTYPSYGWGCFSPEIYYPFFPPKGAVNQMKFGLDAGLYWYNERFSLGVSASNIVKGDFDLTNYASIRVYHLQAAYIQPLTRKISLKGVFNGQMDGNSGDFVAMIYGVYSKNELSLGFGHSNNALQGAISARFANFYMGYFVGYYLSDLNQTRFRNEARIAYELFDNKLNSFDPGGNPAF